MAAAYRAIFLSKQSPEKTAVLPEAVSKQSLIVNGFHFQYYVSGTTSGTIIVLSKKTTKDRFDIKITQTHFDVICYGFNRK